MKKYCFTFIALLCFTFLLTGCGSSNKMVCSGDFEDEGEKHGTTEITAEFEEGKVKKVSAEMIFDNNEYASQAYSMVELFIKLSEQEAAQKGVEAPKLNARLDGKKVVIDDYAGFMDNSSSSEESSGVIGMSKDEFKKFVADTYDNQYTCK